MVKDNAALEAPAAPAPAPAFDMAALAALVRDTVEAAVGPLRAELDHVRAGQPKFVRTPPPANPAARRARTYERPEELRARKLARGQELHTQSRWLDTPEGRAKVPPDYLPMFNPGDLVRLNPQARAWGDTRTWGEILADDRLNPEGLGEVLGTMGHTETWEPKYKVAIRGFSNGSTGVRESELLPYDSY